MRVEPVFVLVALVAACASPTEPPPCLGCGVQVGAEPGDTADPCELGRSVSTAALSDVVLDGHSGEEAMALLGGPHRYTPTWWDGRDEALTLSAEPVGDTVTVYASDVDGCEHTERIRLDASLHLVSEHGTIDERWVWQGHWAAPWNTQELALGVPVGDLAGTLDPDVVDPAAAMLYGWFRIGGDRGDLGYLELGRPNGGGPESRSRFASWGDIEEQTTWDTGR